MRLTSHARLHALLSISFLSLALAACSSQTIVSPNAQVADPAAGATPPTGDEPPPSEPPPSAEPKAVATRWTAVPFAEAGTVKSLSATAPDDAWAVTYDAVFHWDGAAWSSVEIGAKDQPINAVYAASSTAVFVLASQPATIFSFDGKRWTREITGVPATSAYSLIGFGADDLWLGTQWNFGTSTLHSYDGSGWRDEDTGESHSGISGLFGTSGKDIWGLRNGLVGHFDGDSFVDTAVAASAIGGSGPNDVFAVGKGGAIQHFDGTGWSATPSGTGEDLTSVWASNSKAAWAGGFEAFLRWDGVSWSAAGGVDGAPASASLVRGRTATDAWALGPNGAYHLEPR